MQQEQDRATKAQQDVVLLHSYQPSNTKTPFLTNCDARRLKRMCCSEQLS
jgi:hypothetical protein